MSKKRIKHNYTDELELRSLLIREKNKKLNITQDTSYNKQINRYIKLYKKLKHTYYKKGSKKYYQRNKILNKLKDKIIKLSEITSVDRDSHERFGQIILLIIKNILKKPNFSGYTYKNLFYSDAIYKIFTYLHNFDHNLLSKRTNQRVNAFAYISQIVHNSIVFIIKKKNKEQSRVDEYKIQNISELNLNIKNNHNEYVPTPDDAYYNTPEKKIKTIYVDAKPSLLENIKQIEKDPNYILNIYYPKNYRITIEEYYELKPYLNGINILKSKN